MTEVSMVKSNQEYLAVIFRRCVLALIGARVPDDCVLERDAVEYMVMLAEEHMAHLFEQINRLCRMQRRAKPSMADIALLLFFEEINVLDLVLEKEQTGALENTASVNVLNNLTFDLELAPVGASESVFFETPTSLVPSSRKRPSYMPSWMPVLPPEHTYMHTEMYSSGVKDLRQVRQRLVEEGRLAEVALQRLIGDGGSGSIIELPRDGKRGLRAGDMIVVDQEAESPAQPTRTKGLSLRISLNKTKKRKENILGKRPRVDVLELARKQDPRALKSDENDDSRENGSGTPAAKMELDSSDVESAGHNTTQDQTDDFRAALASFTAH